YRPIGGVEDARLEVSVFFFSSRRRHTRFSRDWSSDVCSSDLLLVMPAKEFCSWINVGMFIREATSSRGPLANPPTPTTTSGFIFRINPYDFIRLLISWNGNVRLRIMFFRSRPDIHSPTMGYPAAGTFSISIRPCAPTNWMSD